MQKQIDARYGGTETQAQVEGRLKGGRNSSRLLWAKEEDELLYKLVQTTPPKSGCRGRPGIDWDSILSKGREKEVFIHPHNNTKSALHNRYKYLQRKKGKNVEEEEAGVEEVGSSSKIPRTM